MALEHDSGPAMAAGRAMEWVQVSALTTAMVTAKALEAATAVELVRAWALEKIEALA
jgi:hypothetical protein